MNIKNIILETLKVEVVPAIGCTEPVAVALACAKARELISDDTIEQLDIIVGPNIYKNGLSVGIPNCEEVGLVSAGAIGACGGDSSKDLKVLEIVSDDQREEAKKLIALNKVSIDIKDTSEKIYIEANIKGKNNSAKVIIMKKHNNFVFIKKNDEILLERKIEEVSTSKTERNPLFDMKIRDIVKEVEALNFEDIKFMLDGVDMNEHIANIGLTKKTGMGVGFGIKKSVEDNYLKNDLMTDAMMLTAGASDARMSGMVIPVMSSNGSGNNGLTAILPIVAYKNMFDVSDENLAKAVAISHLMNSYIKHFIGRLSALCACGVAAGTGSGVAIAWLMGCNYDQLDMVIDNVLANTSGMICDGAKEGCALKLSTSASVAVQSALLAKNSFFTPSYNGIIGETCEESIRNLGNLAKEAFETADKVILKVMKSMEDRNSNKELSL